MLKFYVVQVLISIIYDYMSQTDAYTIEITKESFDELLQELEERKNVLRKEIAKEISDARELGDLSENHAYTVAMEKKDLNEARISQLEVMVKNVKVVASHKSSSIVRLGSVVEIENTATGTTRVVTLVGSEQTRSAEPQEGKISIDSPIGEAILNAKLGDKVVAKLPDREIEFKIVKFVS